MHSLVILMMETEQPEGLSARKLVVETAKHNVLTAYGRTDGLELVRRFPNIDIVLVHGMLEECDEIIASVQVIAPGKPIVVASPVPGVSYPGAAHVVPSHEPAALLVLLAREYGASTRN